MESTPESGAVRTGASKKGLYGACRTRKVPPMARPNMTKLVTIRMTRGDFRRLFAVTRRIGGHEDDATVSSLARGWLKAVASLDTAKLLAAYVEMRDCIEKLERRADQLDLGLATPQKHLKEPPEAQGAHELGGAHERAT